MGYCITLANSKFSIKKENFENVLKALKALGNGSNRSDARGGSNTERWFSWMNGANPEKWKTVFHAMKAWRFPCAVNEEGNISQIAFIGEKYGQEKLMFEAIAPFVEAGSYLHFRGEDGAQWKYEFDGKVMVEKFAKIIFT